MENILKLFKHYENKKSLPNDDLQLVLYSDGSGKIKIVCSEDSVFSFNTIEELLIELTS